MSAGLSVKRIARLFIALAVLLLVVAVGSGVWLVLDARRTRAGDPEYVALGSSYAAGAGLGKRHTGSPILCSRSGKGYPQLLARKLDMSIVDMTCSGSVTKHVTAGGQFFQDAQIRTLSRRTQLVTITVGGNDVGFVRDLYLFAARNSGLTLGWIVGKFWNGPPPLAQRGLPELNRALVTLLDAVKARSPEATVVVATYPTVLPRTGTCPALGLTAGQVQEMRSVEVQLAATTRSAARSRGALLVDMNKLGATHDACSTIPWTKGWGGLAQSPFHPNVEGARATAEAIFEALRQ